MKLLLKIYIFVLLSSVAFAQSDSTFTIRGKITQQWDGNPLYYGTIKLEGTTRGAYVDSLGNFTIKNVKSGKYKVNLRSIKTEDLDTSLVILNANIESFNISVPLPHCYEFNVQEAERTTRIDSITLLLVGSLSPRANDSSDFHFEKKYHLQYYEFGCVAPYEYCIVEYNKIIFKYLDQKYGKLWRPEVRPDVIGFKEYINEN